MTEEKKRPVAAAASESKLPGLSMLQVYANGFNLGVSLTDVSCTMMINGVPQVQIHMSFETSKTLAAHLTQTIKKIEHTYGQTFKTMADAQAVIDKAAKSEKDKAS